MDYREIDEATGEIFTNGNALAVSKYQITPIGLEINGTLSYDEWIDCGSQLVGLKNTVQWCIGDWLAYGEGRGAWGEMYTQALDATRISYDTLRKYTYAARVFELFRRRNNLSFSHHLEVAAIEDIDEQDRVLDLASEREWGVRDLRDYLKSLSRTVRQQEIQERARALSGNEALRLLHEAIGQIEAYMRLRSLPAVILKNDVPQQPPAFHDDIPF